MQSTAGAALVGFGMGIPMGIAFRYSNVYDPYIIRSQLELRNWEMMKTFLSAVSVSGVCLSALYATSNATLTARPLNLITTPLGGALLGTGMYLVGACPGTIWAQLGATFQESSFIIAGGMIGSVVYAFVTKYLPSGGQKLFLHEILGYPYLKLALPIFGGIAVGLLAKEYLQNSKSKDKWRPYIGGAIIGLLQIPALYFIQTGLGTSSAFLTIPATCLKLVGITNATIMKYSSYPKNFWQVGLDIGIIAGSWLYSKYHNTPKRPATSSNKVRNLFGGFLILFGARLADGCTSGHGLTGVANLSVSSMVAVASMFGAGMLFAQVGK